MLVTARGSVSQSGLEGFLFFSKASSLGRGLVMGEVLACVIVKALAYLHSNSLLHLSNIQRNLFVPCTEKQPEGKGSELWRREGAGTGHMGRTWKAEMER